MAKILATFLTLGLAAAAPQPPQQLSARDYQTAPGKLVVGAPASISTWDYDGSSFTQTGNLSTAGTAPSWLLYKGNGVMYANDENSEAMSVVKLDASDANPAAAGNASSPAAGSVFMEFNKDRSRMVSAVYGSGVIDIWDTSAAVVPGDANPAPPKFLKNVTLEGPLGPLSGPECEKEANYYNAECQQRIHRPHQAILDPTGRFFLVPDLGGEVVWVLDSKDDKFALAPSKAQLPQKSGPRHGMFSKAGDKTFFVVACELSNKVHVFELEYSEGDVKMTERDAQPTWDPAHAPKNTTSAAVGELVVARNGRDVYVSNRLTGDDGGDTIAHFTLGPEGVLKFVAQTPSGGVSPRMFTLSPDEQQGTLFVANEKGEGAALAAFARDPATGKIDAKPRATLPADKLAGPQYVREIAIP